MNYKQILKKALDILTKREKQYGDAKPLHANIAWRFTAVLKGKLAPGQSLTAFDAARLLAELKGARMDENGYHEDSLLDQINYLVIAYKLANDNTRDFDSGK